jgi:opacity protein-like surface antigen
MRQSIRTLLARAVSGLVLAAALVPAAARSNELSGSMTVYGWLPWIDGKVTSDSSGESISTSISAGDVLDSLKFAFMAAGEVHYGRFGFLHDTVYSKLGNDGTLSGPFMADIDVETKALLALNAIGYKAYESEGKLIEPFVGARYVDIETDVNISGGGPMGAEASASVDENWWEPVIGIRARVPLTERLTAGGFADIGGFGVGSDFTWEIFAGFDYAFSSRISANTGFRYISIDYDADNADVDLDMYGPVLGLTVRF